MVSKSSKAPRDERDPAAATSSDEPRNDEVNLSSAQTHTLGSVSVSPSTQRREIAIRPGQILAERFRVERFLGSGGMGQVFAAQDLVLGETVAVKVMHSVFEGSAVERRRLVREVQLARRVTHRNVCRIFDLFQHREGSEETGDQMTLDIVSMELLEGHNLTDHLQGTSLPVDEALAIARQVARGLNAAHRLGIVHRDLKPGNIMLVQEPEGLRVAVTDFGLARQVGVGEIQGETVLTEEGKILGTPAYMAPEQVADEPTSQATDIYALGIILFECLSGRLPFRGETPWQMAISRLTTPPEPLGRFLPDLPQTLVDLVDRCLERRPENRFASCRDLLSALDQGDSAWEVYGRKGPSPQAVSPPRASSSKLRRPTTDSLFRIDDGSGLFWWLAAAVLAVVSLVFFVRSADRETGPSEPLAAAAQPDSPPEGPDLVAEAIPRTDAPQPRSIEASLLALLDHEAGAEPPALTREQRARRDTALEQAGSRLSVYDPAGARRVLESTLAEIPQDPLLKSALAEALWRLGFEQDARVLIEHARNHIRDDSPREEKLQIEARYAGLTGDWDRARDLYRSLWLLVPTVDYGLWIAEANWMSGYEEPMPEIFEGIRNLLGNTENARVDIWESRLLGAAGESEKALELAQKATATADKGESAALRFAAWRQLDSAWRRAGNPSESNEARRVSQRLLDEVEDHPYFQAYTWMRRARMLLEIGQETEAKLEVDRAYRAFTEMGSDRGQCYLGTEYGLIEFPDLQEKMAVLAGVLESCRRAGLAGIESWVLHHSARTYRDLGQFRRAVDLFFESGEIRSRLGDDQGLAQGWVSLAVLLSKIGRIDEAMAKMETALDLLRRERLAARLQVALLVGANIAIAAGRLDDSRAWLAEAETREVRSVQLLSFYAAKGKLAWADDDAQSLWQAASRLEEHARLLDVGELSYITETFRAVSLRIQGQSAESLDTLRGIGADHEFGGELARALIASDDLSTAEDALHEFEIFVESSSDQAGLWTIEILKAQIEHAQGDPGRLERLAALAKEARALGHRQIALQADLARLRALGSPRDLARLSKEAAELGFNRIAAEAAG